MTFRSWSVPLILSIRRHFFCFTISLSTLNFMIMKKRNNKLYFQILNLRVMDIQFTVCQKRFKKSTPKRNKVRGLGLIGLSYKSHGLTIEIFAVQNRRELTSKTTMNR